MMLSRVIVNGINICIIIYDYLSSCRIFACGGNKIKKARHVTGDRSSVWICRAACTWAEFYHRGRHDPFAAWSQRMRQIKFADKNLKWCGKITLDGVEIGHMPAAQRGVGLMFQDPLLFPHMTVGDNLAFGLRAARSGRSERFQAVLDALHECGMDDFAGRDPASLSGGQKARVALMRALLAAPKMLLLDEAFSSLDPELRQTFGKFVASQVAARQIPALLVSHDPSDKSLTNGAIIKFPSL